MTDTSSRIAAQIDSLHPLAFGQVFFAVRLQGAVLTVALTFHQVTPIRKR
ncbi:MAG: hypothetical protein ACP5SH_15565 [Syntrophobacteraceae bacterium]